MTEDGEEVCAETHVDFDIEESISHPSYSLSHLQNDIGLLRIKGTANFRSGETTVYFLACSLRYRVLIVLLSLHVFVYT
jgi:hypothetical protein